MKATAIDTMTITDVQFLPIVKEYARKINLVGTINRLVETDMETSPGIVVLGMVLDTLSGRSPLYRLVDFLEEKDTELLLGESIPASRFTDHTIGRALDKIYEAGTQKIFGQLSQNAVGGFQIEPSGAHFDTTSIRVYGDYDMQDEPFKITYGHSKDHRPDLKQFLIEMLCVDRNIPLFGATRDGNASDKTLNNELLTTISTHMANHGLDRNAFVYVADSAFVTTENLAKAGEDIKFLSRLPATYKECGRVIKDAVERNAWVDMGVIAETDETSKRPSACYKAFDTTVVLAETTYRAIVVHSSAHDKRRHRRIDNHLAKNKKELEQRVKKILAETYFCEEDARAAAEKLSRLPNRTDCYIIQASVHETRKYRRGRPKQGEERDVDRLEYSVDALLVEDESKIKNLRLEAGCFVLLTNLSSSMERTAWSPKDLLSLYKNQGGIERNFGFLKDPVIINSIFLKKNSRIEVLGLILLISLLIWRLIERTMRQHLDQEQTTITGWVRRKTKRPTAFMMSTKFHTILVVKMKNKRLLARPLKPVQLEYLRALDIDPNVFVTP